MPKTPFATSHERALRVAEENERLKVELEHYRNIVLNNTWPGDILKRWREDAELCDRILEAVVVIVGPMTEAQTAAIKARVFPPGPAIG